MITIMASEAHDVDNISTGGGAETGMPSGLAAPGGTLSTPSGDTAGPAHPAEFAEVEWQMPFWGRPDGHRERLELTDLVRGAIAGGKLVRVDELEAATPADQAPAEGEGEAAKRPRRTRG